MSATELSPQGTESDLAQARAEEARKARTSYATRASTDFYGVVGWLVGGALTLFVSIPVILLLVNNASRSSRDSILATGIAIAWWFTPLSLGALGYVVSNLRVWRGWTVLGLFLLAFVNTLVS